MPPIICAIVPAYNEEDNIASVIADLRGHRPEIDIVVVNDCSKDGTEEIARGLNVTVLSLVVNLGIGGAVQAGLIFARDRGCGYALQFDGDGQHMASEIVQLLKPILTGEADVVIGSRFLGDGEFRSSHIRRLGIRLISLVNRLLTGVRILDSTSGFRAYSRAALCFLADHYSQDFPEPEAVVQLARNRFRIREVPVQMRARSGGRSSIGPSYSVYYIIKVLLSNIIGSSGIGRRDVK